MASTKYAAIKCFLSPAHPHPFLGSIKSCIVTSTSTNIDEVTTETDENDTDYVV